MQPRSLSAFLISFFMTTALLAQENAQKNLLSTEAPPVDSLVAKPISVDSLSAENRPTDSLAIKALLAESLSIKTLLANSTAVELPPVDSLSKKITFAMVGDMMIGRNWPDETPELPPEDGATIFELVTPLLQSAEITIGNLEGVLLDEGGTVKNCNDPKMCYAFRSPERYARHFADAGFDLLSVANNHTGDFGPAGRESTRRALDGVGITYAGHENDAETAVLEKGGIKYGFTAFSVNTGTLKVQDETKAKQLIAELRERSDIVIVSMHIGAEGKKYNRITRETENFLGENRGNPWRFARVAIDAGADLVVGHGPHVARAIDLYKGRFIAYSLGNFATTTGVNISGISGYAPIIEVTTDQEGRFLEGKIFSAIQRGNIGARRPVPDSTGACIREIKLLTEKDLPESELLIGEDGSISLKLQKD